MLENSTVIRIPTKFDLQFFKYWVEILRPVHHINPKDCEVLAALLHKRYELSQKINDATLLDQVLMSNEIRKEVREECNIPPDYFLVILNHLRNKKAIINNRLNPKFIPNFEKNDIKDFKLIFHFDFNES